MARPAKFSATPLARVRRHFGLDQATLAAYLGIGAGMVGHLEAGRKPTSQAAAQRLRPLLQALATPTEAPSPTILLAPPDPAPLAARLAYCQHHAARLRRELAALSTQLEHARRWQAALPTLLAQASTEDERARQWLLRRQAQATADLDADTATRYHLLRLRADALEAEATGLAALLPPAGSPAA